MTTYDDAKYGMIQRKWFGRPLTKGGDAAAGIALTASGTTKTVVKGFPFKGPIVIEKVGIQVIATLASADNATGSVDRARLPVEFYKGSSAARTTLLGTVHAILGDTGRQSLWTIASQEGSSLASQEFEAGQHLTIFLATANSHNGTAAGAIGTVAGGGTLAYFVDYRPKYSDTKWDKSHSGG